MATHVEHFEKMDNNYKILLKTEKYYLNEDLLYNFMLDFKKLLYDIIYNQLSSDIISDVNERYIRFYCNYIKNNILPLCNKKIEVLKTKLEKEENVANIEKDNLNYQRWVNLEDDYYAMVAYRNLKYYAYYIERAKKPKNRIWNKTMVLFESFAYYADEMILNDKVDKIRASFMPSMGKTYFCNLLCSFWISYDKEMTILRITYAEDLAKKFTKQISNILQSERHKKVFPKFNKEKKDIFAENSAFCIKLKGSEENNFNAMTRYGQVTGKRGKLLITDDLLKGKIEAGNFKLQDEIVGMYDSDWTSRADDDNQKEVHVGTMWSNHDLLNVIEKRDSEITKFEMDKTYKYTKTGFEGRAVYIGVPALDYDTDQSTCPLRYSTEFLRRKRDTIDPYIWKAEYQQKPDEPEGLPFAYSKLKTYNSETFPKEILEGRCECRVAIDPNRRGIDYFVCPILKRYIVNHDEYGNEIWSDWYLVDILCKKDIYKNLKVLLISKLIKNRASKISVEINTSNELPDLLEEDFEDNGYFDYDISQVYSTDNKETKIAMAQYDMRDHIIFPAKGMFASNSEMGIAMEMLTTYTFEKKVEHDDVPDILAIFTKENIGNDEENGIEVVSRL